MEKKNTTENRSITAYKSDFEALYGIITTHRNRVVQQLNGETVMMVWEVGGFVSGKLKTSAWGSGVVRQLAEFIHTQDPTVRGRSYRTIYKMVQFYETYSSPAFVELIGKVKPQLVPVEMAQIPDRQIVPIESAQIPAVLFSTGWSNHQLIMNYCKTDEQRLFYILYALQGGQHGGGTVRIEPQHVAHHGGAIQRAAAGGWCNTAQFGGVLQILG